MNYLTQTFQISYMHGKKYLFISLIKKQFKRGYTMYCFSANLPFIILHLILNRINGSSRSKILIQ